MEDRTPLWHNKQRQVGAGRPPTRHQVVSGVAPSKSCSFGLRFWSRRTAKHPGLTAILVPDSNTMEDRTPLWHNNQRQVGAGRPPTRHQVVSGVAPSKSCSFGLRFWSRRIAKHPGLTAILVPDSNTMEDRTPLWYNKQRQVGAGRPPTRHQVVSGVAPSKSCSFGIRFWSRRIAKHPGLTAILVPDSNTMEDRTPLWHNNQRKVGAGRPPTRHQVVSGVAPSKSC